MREFSYRIDKGLVKGLAPTKRTVDANVGLKQALNLEATREGLRNFSAHRQPTVLMTDAAMTSAGVGHVRPYPHIFNAGYYMTSISQTTQSIYALPSNGNHVHKMTIGSNPPSDTSASAIYIKKHDDPTANATIALSKPWSSYAYGGGNFFAFNGTQVLFRCNLATINPEWTDTNNQILLYPGGADDSLSEMHPHSGCYHEGRLILAGFSGVKSNFLSGEVYEELERIQDEMLNDGYIDAEVYLGQNGDFRNYIWWSSIGGGDMLAPFYSQLLLEGGINNTYNPWGTDRNRWEDIVDRNQSGYMPMPFQNNTIRDVLPFGKGFIVYGSRGIAYCPAVNKGNISTYGCKVISNSIGLRDKGCVAGNIGKHVFVDDSGNIWSLSMGKTKSGQAVTGGLPQLTKIYERTGVAAQTTNVVYDTTLNNWYINISNSEGYIYNSYGLTETNYRPTSILEGANNSTVDDDVRSDIWVYDTDGDATSHDITLQTQPINMNISGIKLIKSISINWEKGGWDANFLNSSNCKIQLWVRGSDGTYTKKADTPVNTFNSAYINIACEEFYIVISLKDEGTLKDKEVSIDSIDVKWSLLDKRFTRGYYPQQGGQGKR